MKRLYRSKEHRIIGGVSGGLGEYLDIDPVLIRIGFVVTVFAGGAGILAYIIAWIIIPEQPRDTPMTTSTETQQPNTPPPPPEPPKREEKRGSIVGGMVLLVLGLLFLANNFLPDFHFEDWWPLILVAIGAGLLYKAVRPVKS
jgi:phage shock protein PspC (stress-responsive transcriptional regulator)